MNSEGPRHVSESPEYRIPSPSSILPLPFKTIKMVGISSEWDEGWMDGGGKEGEGTSIQGVSLFPLPSPLGPNPLRILYSSLLYLLPFLSLSSPHLPSSSPVPDSMRCSAIQVEIARSRFPECTIPPPFIPLPADSWGHGKVLLHLISLESSRRAVLCTNLMHEVGSTTWNRGHRFQYSISTLSNDSVCSQHLLNNI